jgi:SAM-dependent methyltransferase
MAENESSTKQGAAIWDGLYGRGEGKLAYPSEALVRITHRLFKPELHRSILDYGFGAGANLIHLLRKGYVLSGLEISPIVTSELTERLRVMDLEADLRTSSIGIPFADETFDAVIAWQVLYYNTWDTLREAVAEIDRVLKPGGLFLGTMAASGDYSHTHSIPIGDGLFRSTVAGQEGSTVIILDETDLGRCFPGKVLTKGQFNFEFGPRHSKHWVVSWEK